MGDIRKIIDKVAAELDQIVLQGAYTRSQLEEPLWQLWEASYRDGYKDGQEDAS